MVNEKLEKLAREEEEKLHNRIRELKAKGKTYQEIQIALNLGSNYHIKKALGKKYKANSEYYSNYYSNKNNNNMKELEKQKQILEMEVFDLKQKNQHMLETLRKINNILKGVIPNIKRIIGN